MTDIVEMDVCSADNINVCKVTAEHSQNNVTVWFHSPIINQWRISEKITFQNGELGTDAKNEILQECLDFLHYERKTANYISVAGCLNTFFEMVERATWYTKPISIPEGVELFGEKGGLNVKTISEIIMKKYKFITFSDTLDIMIYVDGVYRPHAEQVVSVAVQLLLGEKSKERHQKEVLNFIKYTTLVSRKEVYAGTRYINLLNGVYDREANELISHTPSIIFTYQIPVNYDAMAKCPQVQKFFNDVLQPEDVLCTLEFFGYCLIPDTSIQKAVMLVGGGENGKSKLLGLLTALVGCENTSKESLQGLEKDPYSCAELYGKLVNVFPDLPSQALFENSVFKMLTGDDGELRARRIYGQPFKYTNSAKLIFSANQAPPAPRGDYAYYRRWLIFDFVNTFNGENRDPNILEKITTDSELSGLFNLVIPALNNLLKNEKFTYSRSNDQVEKLYKIKSDPIAAFAEECIVYSDDDTPKRDVYQRYAQWCHDKNIKMDAENIFGRRFRKLGYDTSQETLSGVRVRVWNSCVIRSNNDDCTGLQYEPVHKKQYRENTDIYIDNKCTGLQYEPVQIKQYHENDCTGCTCKTPILNIESSQKVRNMQHIGNQVGNLCSSEQNTSPDIENDLHRLESDTCALYENIKDLSLFCQDWEYVFNKSINSKNCVEVAMEYAKKRNVENVEEIINTIRHMKGISS